MSNQDSKRYYITLSKEEVAEVEGQAEQQQIPVAHVVRNRYRQQVQSQKHSGAEVNSHSAQSISEQSASSPDNSQQLPTMPEATIDPLIMEQFSNQMTRVEAQLDELRLEVRQLVEEGTPTQPTIEPQLRASLQPLYARLQQTETQMSEVGKLLVQVVERLAEISQVMGSDRAQSALQFQRLEAFLEVVHLLNERQLIALTPAEMRVQEQDFMNEVHTQLQQYLEGDGRLNR